MMFKKFFNKLAGNFEPENIILDSHLRNTLLSGASKKGIARTMEHIMFSSLYQGLPILVIRDISHPLSPSCYKTRGRINGRIKTIDITAPVLSEKFNPFYNKSDYEIDIFIINLFEKYSNIDGSKRVSFINYINRLRKFMNYTNKYIPIKDFCLCNYEDMYRLNEEDRNAPDYNSNIRLLDSLRNDISTIEMYFNIFANNEIGDLISGTNPIEKICNNSIFEIVLDFSSKAFESQMLFEIITDSLTSMNRNAFDKKELEVFLCGIPNKCLIDSHYKQVLSSSVINSFYIVEDVDYLVNQDTNIWLERTNSFMFFKQISAKNKLFCADFFGKKEFFNTSSSRSRKVGFFNQSIDDEKTITETEQRTIEHLYKEELFDSLGEYEAIVKFRNFRGEGDYVSRILIDHGEKNFNKKVIE